MILRNGIVEAVIVPEVGRVMQFRFAGEFSGPFWENRSLDGQKSSASNWETEGSFGGDKSWPAPQSDWGWPPPLGFDGSTNTLTFTKGKATLVTPVDPKYQIRATRIVDLAEGKPIMRIRTVFERVAPTALTNKPLAVWVITQLGEPELCAASVPAPSIFTNGFARLGDGMPAEFKKANGLITFKRDTAQSRKLGFDAGSMAWIGKELCLRIDAPRIPGLGKNAYPDDGSSTEIYTNHGAPYVELESLGPLSKLQPGERMELVTVYTLSKRTLPDPEAEARRLLGR